MLDCDGGARLRTKYATVPGVWDMGGVLKMSSVLFHKWKIQGLVNSPPSILAVFMYSAYFCLVLHLKMLSHWLMLLCHSPVGELSMTRKCWRKMRCRCGNCIHIPLQCSCCWRARTVTLTLFLCGACLHQSVNLLSAFQFRLPAPMEQLVQCACILPGHPPQGWLSP